MRIGKNAQDYLLLAVLSFVSFFALQAFVWSVGTSDDVLTSFAGGLFVALVHAVPIFLVTAPHHIVSFPLKHRLSPLKYAAVSGLLVVGLVVTIDLLGLWIDSTTTVPRLIAAGTAFLAVDVLAYRSVRPGGHIGGKQAVA